jgi:hypothetical protein
MTFIFVQTKRSRVADNFFKSTQQKLQSPDLIKNAFYGNVKRIGKETSIIYMRPAYFFFNLPQWLLRLMIKKGLKKAGYTGEVKFISLEEGIKRMLNWDK